MISTVAIIHTFNQAQTLPSILASIKDSRVITRVLIVDAGSRDQTEHVASAWNASLLQFPDPVDRTRAIRHGLGVTWEPAVLLLDAGLVGLTPGHIQRLVAPVLSGQCVMSAGLRDFGPVWNRLQQALPRIAPERAVLRTVLDQVPDAFWHDSRLEIGLNAVARRVGKVCDVPLWGTTTNQTLQGIVHKGYELLTALADAQRIG